jgi:peptidoglycan/LPS O-acetylase OafA/YrhL
MNTRNTAYRPEIDGLRAVAVLAVLGYHFFPGQVPGGFVGVDVFFVISGFLICGIILDDLQAGSFSLWNFYSRRIRRIFPALLLVLATVLCFGWFVLFPDEYRALGKHVFGGSAFMANFLLWREAGYFDIAAKAKPLLHLWSLGIEEQFYIVFPFLLWCCAKKHFRLATIIMALGLASFLENMHRMPDTAADFYSPLARAWELLAGAALCLARRRPWLKELSRKLDILAGKIIYDHEYDGRNPGLFFALLGAVLLTAALLIVRDDAPYPGWKALWPVSGAIFLLAAPSTNPISQRLLANRPAVFIGRISYPLYLWHWALLSYAFILNGGLDPGSWSTWPLRAGLATASFALAALTYFLVEKPIRFGARARNGKIYALIIGMAIVGAAGLAVRGTDGAAGRSVFEKQARIMEQLEPDLRTDEAGLAYAGLAEGELIYCRYTEAGAAETVAVIGDSHAHSAYRGIAKLGRELGYNTVLLGRLIPAGEILHEIGPQHYEKLLEEIAFSFDVLNEKKDIRKVFIFTRGPIYITGLEQYDLGEFLPMGVGCEPFKKSLQQYVDTLRGYGLEVFIVAENPELPAQPRDYIHRPFKIAPTKLPDVHKADVVQRQENYLQLLAEIRDATIIYTIEKMCPEDKCLVFTEDGLPLYYDDDHLSFAGSEFQAERILKPYLIKKQ